MSRRPYIQQKIIKDELAARGYSSRPNEYSSHCTDYEVVGMDGRCDWFRWHCRDCDEKFISRRNEKSMARYQCTECGAWHFVYKGFFTLPDKPNGSETVPLKQSEVDGTLYRAKLVYAPDGEAVLDEGSWFYGHEDYIKSHVGDGPYRVETPMHRVGRVTA